MTPSDAPGGPLSEAEFNDYLARSLVGMAAKEEAAAREKASADTVDAQRYRWLRNHRSVVMPETPAELDAFVDAQLGHPQPETAG